MSVTLTGTSSGDQGLFNRLGALGALLNAVNAARTTLDGETEDALELYDGSSTTIRGTIDGLLDRLDRQIRAMDTLPRAVRDSGQRTLVAMFDADQPLPARTVDWALDYLIRQMKTATTRYVEGNAVGASVTATSLTGNGNVVVSTKNARGVTLENLRAERLLLRCTDAETAGAETIAVDGEAAETDILSHLWPAGSGARAALVSLAADADDNLVSNGAFETFTVADQADDWTYVDGTATTHIAEETSTFYAGTSALKFLGNGTKQHRIRVALDLEPLTQYAFNIYLRNSTNPAAGALAIRLHDGSNVINDDAGTANTTTIDLTTLGTTFVAKSAVFRTPSELPTTVYLDLYCSTAISNTHTLYLDHLAGQEMQSLTPGAPGATPPVAVFSGATAWSLDDGNLREPSQSWLITTTNDRASEWQELFDKLFDMARRDLTLPTSGTTVIDDALIA